MSDIYPNGTMHAEGALTGSMEQSGNLKGSLSGNGNLIGSIDKIMKIPTNTSDLTNDSGFITEDDIPPIPEKTSDLTNDSGFITEDDIPPIPEKTSDLTNDSGFITSNDIPSIPEKTSDLTNDSGFITSNDIPSIPEKTSDLTNDSGFITEDDIPPLVTDLGVIDGDQYDWDVEEYLNTLQETGSYMFFWDEFRNWVDIEALEVDGTTTVKQIYWGTEEGSSVTSYRNLVVEDGEIVSTYTTTYLTFQEANSAFARNTHTHVRFETKAQSIWDFCNTVGMQNTNPIVIYFDSSTNKTYVIETYAGNRQPVYKMQKVSEMNDASYFCQRLSYYYSGAEHWGDWYKFSGTIFDPGGR